MTQAERDALDMCSHFEDSGSISRTVAECQEYIGEQRWSLNHERAVIEAYKKFIYSEGFEVKS
jgi:hypothetical protein